MGAIRSTVSLPLYLTDHVRSVLTFGALAAAQPWLSRAQPGDGQSVIVMPGLAAGDLSTAPLRGYLRGLGYDATGWGLGFNIGPTRKVLSGLQPLVEEISNKRGSQVALVGWSLGGVFARLVARQVPDAVSQVITLGSPFRLEHPEQARSSRFFESLARWHAPRDEWPEQDSQLPTLPVPASSIYSRYDGIVDWRTCIDTVDATHENIQVRSSHLGFGHDPAVLWAVADRLAQPAGTWQPFKPPRCAMFAYPTTHDPRFPNQQEVPR